MILSEHLERYPIVWRGVDGISVLYEADAFSVMADIPDNSVDCIWTDPPYLLSNDGVTCVAGKRVSVNKGEWDRSRGIDDDHLFNISWLSECYRILKPAGTIWVTGTVHSYLSVGMGMRQLGFRILNDIIWEKTNPPPNLGCRCFTHATEILLWATKALKGSKHKYTFHYEDMKMEASPRAAQWDALMREFQVPVPDAGPDEWWAAMEEVFDLNA